MMVVTRRTIRLTSDLGEWENVAYGRGQKQLWACRNVLASGDPEELPFIGLCWHEVSEDEAVELARVYVEVPVVDPITEIDLDA